MAHSSRSPRVLCGGLVLLQPPAWQVLQVVAFQHNPEVLRRRITVIASPNAALPESTMSRRQSGWVEGPLGWITSWWPFGSAGNPPAARERIEMELVFDAADDLEYPDVHPETARLGLLPRLDALRAVALPTTSTGPSPVLMFLFGARPPVPVHVSTLAIDEETFSPSLCPLHARARLELDVLAPSEVPSGLPELALQEALRSMKKTVESA